MNTNNNTPSLGRLLEAERRAYRRNQTPAICAPSNFSPVIQVSNPNPLFVNDQIAPQSTAASLGANTESNSSRALVEHDNGYGVTLLLSRLCGQLIK